MKEQQKRKIQQFHPEIEDGIDLRRCPQSKVLTHKNSDARTGKMTRSVCYNARCNMWSCACARAWLSLSPHKYQQTLFFYFYQCWRLSWMSWEINTSSIHHMPSEDSKVKMGAKAVVLTMTTFENLYKQVPSSHVWWPFVDLGRAIRSPRKRPIWSLGHH